MIRPPGKDGVAFSERGDGDLREDPDSRELLARALDVPAQWAWARQVHGADLVRVEGPGNAGEFDALWTTIPGLPLAIFTADCLGVVLKSDEAVGVAHAGWRGADAGVVPALREAMTRAGHEPRFAAVGPGIGPCCFEVGPEVMQRFPSHGGETTWGTTSVDLAGVVMGQLDGLEIWSAGGCTRHDERFFSHRRDGTTQRMVSLGWLR
ncbi:MAG TPA: polyphenol oxidase family protein [Acidimicrobiia bacterium]|jgi:YfiH family protein|nr:polyphenol oxidase family protein [Acidimicrobiia bacterium]